MKRRLALFDFDGTLIKGDSFILFGKFAVGQSNFLKALFKSFPVLVGWKLGLRSSSEAKQRLFYNLFNGMPLHEFERKCLDFKAEIESREKPSVMKELKTHIARGDEVAIVSASVADWIRPWAESRGIATVIGTEAEKKNGLLTGRFSTPNCKGEEKVRRVKESYPDWGEYEIFAYGDSSGDDAMLALADHPQKV